MASQRAPWDVLLDTYFRADHGGGGSEGDRSLGFRRSEMSFDASAPCTFDIEPIGATLVAVSVVARTALKDAKNRLSEVVDRVKREPVRVVITPHGRPAAVVMSIDDLESLEETPDVMTKPSVVSQIRDSPRGS